ncbi:MAG: hypothetical protein DI570_09830 [Phenylobacterium zucineum]|nr:MAG: hypothetical protein DI570_09830 [Phenylobacterium zucineum]
MRDRDAGSLRDGLKSVGPQQTGARHVDPEPMERAELPVLRRSPLPDRAAQPFRRRLRTTGLGQGLAASGGRGPGHGGGARGCSFRGGRRRLGAPDAGQEPARGVPQQWRLHRQRRRRPRGGGGETRRLRLGLGPGGGQAGRAGHPGGRRLSHRRGG